MTPPPLGTGPNRYTTLPPGAALRHELEVKRSRFITILTRVEDEEQARAALLELRREFHDARHHCSAYLLGPGRHVQRAHDDGEPSGTAGAPMLEALTRRPTGDDGATDLSDVLAVVVRYFGGILLGAGGLVRAYSASVSAALDVAPLVRRDRLRLLTVGVAHGDAGRRENELRAAGLLVTGTAYGPLEAVVSLAVADDAAAIDAVRTRWASLTAGQGAVLDAGTAWVDAARTP